jgi:hypothetical protein
LIAVAGFAALTAGAAMGFATSATVMLFSMRTAIADGRVALVEAMRVESLRSRFASAGCMVLTAVSILPETGAKTEADMASNAIAIIMPPCA